MRRSMQWVAIGLCTFSLVGGGQVFAQSTPGMTPDTGMSKPTTPDPTKTGTGMEKVTKPGMTPDTGMSKPAMTDPTKTRTGMEKVTKPGMMPDTGMSKPAMTDPGKVATGATMEKGKMAPGMASPKAALVDLNTADEKTLTSLKGVGPAKAKSIMQYRQDNGGFKSVDELTKVPGFGKKSLAALKPLVTVGTMGQ